MSVVKNARYVGRVYHGILVHHPFLVMLVTFIPVILLTVITFGVYSFDIDTDNRGFAVRGHETHNNFVMLREAIGETIYQVVPPDSTSDVVIPERTSPAFGLTVFYEDAKGPSGNLLTDSMISKIKSFEEGLRATDTFKELAFRVPDLNLTTMSPVCCADFTGMTLINFLYPQVIVVPFSPDPIILANGKGDSMGGTIEAVLTGYLSKNGTAGSIMGMTKNETADSIMGMLHRDFGIDNLESFILYSTFMFGLPLPGYDNAEDNYDEQKAKFDEKILDLLDFLDPQRDELEDDIKLMWIGSGITDFEFESLILVDGSFALLAVIIVFIYVWFHTRSLFLTILGMFHVIISFPCGYFFIRVVMGVEGFSMLNTLSIFVILGIGADDIFIFLDAWKQSKLLQGDISSSLESRMSYSHSRATFAMLITTVTTSFAFLANVVSIVPPIRIFGLFTGLIVIINYLLVITWFPAVVVVWTIYFEPRNWYGKKVMKDPVVRDQVVELPRIEEGEVVSEEGLARDDISEQDVAKLRILEKFFWKYWSPFVNKGKFVIMAVFIILAIVSAIGASQLQAASEAARFLPDDHPVQRAIDLQVSEFAGGDMESYTNQVFIVWGLKELDNEGVDFNDPSSIGVPIYDDEFDLSTPEAQAHFLEACRLAREEESSTGVLCVLEHVRDFYNGTIPTGSEFLPGIIHFIRQFQTPTFVSLSPFAPKLSSFEETLRFKPDSIVSQTGTAIGVETAFVPVPGTRVGASNTTESFTDVGVNMYTATSTEYSELTAPLAFALIVVNISTIGWVPATFTEPIYDEWVEYIDALNAVAPPGMKNGIQSSDSWTIMQMELVLVGTAIAGIITSLCLALFFIVIFTRNLIIAPLAFLGIVGIVLTMLGFIYVIGWEIGIIESICATVLVGLSVDYVVHLAIAVNVSKLTNRYDRVRMGLSTMGISVLSAAFTTIFSSCALLLTTVLFFVKFGLFVLMTIFTSTLYAFLFFAACSFAFAPKNYEAFRFETLLKKLKKK